ncbi:autophagy protein Apg5-domain-containing protein [Apodospora peruviana]|uniref:Autophagy protein 5 n=1 Tax=Apodospora peruviana TaxID=516989 RepID=A0AAE0MAA4_9PEZI|nr:autophagy protein Apg5-domain-containing protein [Apodospora peruviana]
MSGAGRSRDPTGRPKAPHATRADTEQWLDARHRQPYRAPHLHGGLINPAKQLLGPTRHCRQSTCGLTRRFRTPFQVTFRFIGRPRLQVRTARKEIMSSPSPLPAAAAGALQGSGRQAAGHGQGHTRRDSRNNDNNSTPPPLEKEVVDSNTIPQTLWGLRIPLFITHTSQPTNPFITSVPRFGYLALLLPRLNLFYNAPCSSFHHEGVQLRNLAVGLLADLYQPSLPWKLVVGDGPEWDIGDTFMNSAKEADFVRNGNAKQIMSLSKEHTTALWNAVQDNDYAAFTKINTHLLLNAPTPLKNVPLRIYIPSTPPDAADAVPGSFKVMQTLVPPRLAATKDNGGPPQTLGAALKTVLPSLFPSSRDPVLATVMCHGASVPFRAPLEELMREASYPDGWLCLAVVLL